MTVRGAGRPRPEAGDGGEGEDDASDAGRPRPAVGPGAVRRSKRTGAMAEEGGADAGGSCHAPRA